MKPLRPIRSLARVALGAVAWASSSCAPSGFADVATIASVRVMASQADKPYAKPGDTVTLQVLAYDGRPVKPEPMTIYWLPFVCENPAGDAYYACFTQLGGGSSGSGGSASGSSGGYGAGGAPGGASLRPGVDLTPLLPTGPTYKFQMPQDAVTSHVPTPGVAAQYGLAILFNIACAGHIEIVPVDPNSGNPQQVPVGCFDQNHNQLGPDDWVFGFTRVYAYDDVTNENPVISGVDIQGTTFVPDAQPPEVMNGTLVAKHCTAGKDCPKIPIGPIVPASSQETQTQVAAGSPQKEEIWADFYSTLGQFDSDARLLYDATTGSIGAASVTDNKFLPPNDPGAGFIWIVVHDNRGGASWVTVPVRVE